MPEQTPELRDAGEMQRSHSKASKEDEPGSPWLEMVEVESGAALLPAARDGEQASRRHWCL